MGTTNEETKSRKEVPALELLKGVGQQRLPLFRRIGVRRSLDLLFLFPRSYQEIALPTNVLQLSAGVRSSVHGTVESIDYRAYANGSALGCLLQCDGGFLRLVWYNQEFRRHQIVRGMRILATGIPKPTGLSFEMRHPEIRILADEEQVDSAAPIPVYPLTDGLKQHHVRNAVESALDAMADSIPDVLPEDFRAEHSLLSIGEALRKLHQPNDMEEAKQARRRFIFQEFLAYQLALSVRRHRLRHESIAPTLQPDGKIHARILRRFSFELTGDQLRAIDQIREDLKSPTPMNRLLQGDVGSGKTVVAVYAMLLAVAHGYQATLMAPTEALAMQHYRKLVASLAESRVEIGLLTGSLSQRDRNDMLDRIALGTVDLVIGTQALLGEHVEFNRLAIAIIDEQHKFGVQQRALLRRGTHSPHYLVLSATPIPRTITMSAFGDLDVSILREKPKGRASVTTYLGKPDQHESWWRFVRSEIAKGRQAYVIVPRVEANEENAYQGVEQVASDLQESVFQGLRVAMLHGRLNSDTMQTTLEDFSSGSIHVLVATTVVEVGIDVPNATVMTILDANLLGLAQLHQLRGRISRGSHPGYLCVFASRDVSAEENQRLSALESTSDGFDLAELDLQMRGPGNLLGTSQTGLPPFRIADLVKDENILMETRDIAEAIIAEDPSLETPRWSGIHSQVFSRHGEMLDLGDVG